MAQCASGVYVTATNGKRYLDFTSGIGATSTGHSHPVVASAIAEQAKTHLFAQQNCIPGTVARARAAESLRRVLPSHLEQVILVNSGSEAVDQAVKIARHATRKPNIIAFAGSFHGRTVAAMSLSTSKSIYSKTMHTMHGTIVAPFPACLHCPVCAPRAWEQAPTQSQQYKENHGFTIAVAMFASSEQTLPSCAQ